MNQELLTELNTFLAGLKIRPSSQREYELWLLSIVSWREARGEGLLGLLCVQCSIRNRVKRPSWWGSTYPEVIRKSWQYSAMTAPGDRMTISWPVTVNDQQFGLTRELAEVVYDDKITSPVPGADSYYSDVIPAPKWAAQHPECFVEQIGHHKFYNMDNDFEWAEIEKRLWPTN